MSTDRFGLPDPFDPELRELLREIAARQESQLLRPRSARNVRELLGEGEWTRAGATGLSSAERHLLTRYREEAARLLSLMAHERLRKASSFSRLLCERTVRSPETRRPMQRLAGQLEREVACLSAGYEWEGQSPELGIALKLARSAHPSVSALARVSLRIAPSFEARLCLAADLLRMNSFDAALASYSRLVQIAAMSSDRICAATWRGILLGRRGEFHAAMDAHRECARSQKEDPLHAWNWLAYALQAGDDHESSAAVTFVDREVRHDEAGITRWLSNAAEQLKAGEWSVNESATACAQRVASKAGSEAGRILNVFF